jgi:Fe-S-cluster containining protein
MRMRSYPHVFAGGEEELHIFLQFEELLCVFLNARNSCRMDQAREELNEAIN